MFSVITVHHSMNVVKITHAVLALVGGYAIHMIEDDGRG
jgi:hypothetical protein